MTMSEKVTLVVGAVLLAAILGSMALLYGVNGKRILPPVTSEPVNPAPRPPPANPEDLDGLWAQ